jgi:nitrite reductase/ring-hydroxylating ferredoxin subunit
MPRYVVASTADIPPGGRKRVEVRGRPIVIFNLSGEFFGLLDRCPHQGSALCGGILIGRTTSTRPGEYEYSRPGEVIRCPWHGWEFDIRTGQSYCDPGRVHVTNYPVAVAHGDDVVKGPYVAETIEVSVEDDYVMVDV